MGVYEGTIGNLVNPLIYTTADKHVAYVWVRGTNKHWCYDKDADSFYSIESGETIGSLIQSTQLGLLGYLAISGVDYAREEINREEVVFKIQ